MAEKIKQYLKENGISVRFLARKSGLNFRVIYDIFNAGRKITIEEYAAICKALNLNLDYFFEDSGNKTA